MKKLMLAVIVLGLGGTANAGLVKMTSDYVCHTSESPWYEKSYNFVGYESVESCLADGGTLPRSLRRDNQKLVDQMYGAKEKKPYKREFFGDDWADIDRDCRNTRAELLASLSTSKVRYRNSGCTVDKGKWISPFTSRVYYKASDLEIDHVYPLALAWERGAYAWPYAMRVEFANDPINLQPVEKALNRSKGAKSINKWLPPMNQCSYVYRFVRVAKTYGLPLTSDEELVLRNCKSGFQEQKTKKVLDLGIIRFGGAFESSLGTK